MGVVVVRSGEERENEVYEETKSSYGSFIYHVCVGFIHVWMNGWYFIFSMT